ncbi:MAG: iron dicitrate transport regulator FecR, partial [Cytophagaceae bacterium]
MSRTPDDFLTVEDFLESDAFRTWVKEKNPQDQLFWQQWQARHPGRQLLYEQAVATLLIIQGQTNDITPEQARTQANRILAQLPEAKAHGRLLWQWGRWAAAAAIVAGVLFLWQFDNVPGAPVARAAYEASERLPASDWKAIYNKTGQSLVVLLPDHSSVLLSTGSQLRFRRRDDQPLREVYLQGEGFFEVTHNPTRPFLVYAPSLTTKVLGTSFEVRSFDKETVASVLVKTGRVAVSSALIPDEPVQLTVREKLIFTPGTNALVKQKSAPEVRASSVVDQEFVYNYTPVTAIFDQLEASYHMPIQYEPASLKTCTFTGQLNGVPFLEKIRLVCLAIEATFEVVNGQLLIKGKG